MKPAVINLIGRMLGVGLAVAYLPGTSQPDTVGRMIVGWIGVAVLLWIAPRCQWSLPGTALLALATVSLAWAAILPDAAFELLQWLLLAGSFALGTAGIAASVFEGAAWGMAINAALAIGQVFGWHPVIEAVSPAGLFGNKDHMAEAALLVTIPLIWQSRLWLAALISPALLLPRDRAVLIAAAAAAVIGLWSQSRGLAVALGIAGLIAAAAISFTSDKQLSAHQRLDLWRGTIAGLTFEGHGIGQFHSGWPLQNKRKAEAMRPEHADNDWLELAYELGVAGAFLALMFGLVIAASPPSPERLVCIAFAVVACFSFPLHNVATGLLGLCAAGAVYRDRAALRRGHPVRPGLADGGAFGRASHGADHGGRESLSVRSGIPEGAA